MCAGVSFQLKRAVERNKERKKEKPVSATPFQGEDSEKEEEETSVIEQVEEYGGPSVSKVNEASTQVEHVNGMQKEMACSLSQVLRRRKRQAAENSDELFRQEIEWAAPEACREDYERVPVESFGKYMLNKMGWKGEEHRQVDNWQNKARPPRLGLGAKVLHNASK
ncbi:hypothetical protein Gasu2_27430 [Galdieria sulphuraria]|uniref:Nucleic acid binding protein n=1 Tax=Galdieria sulphuraria TaxID=130081 RepID=M2Y2V5_GALSU|nr:nucleic acid binding protein [Galdieria sulphuraria]EME30273.1 nucleic acid binding protein [Galdieria sulphuraria]GJD08439.1 hypothetical protein Gasu2_27430 [Galdieria sulphuraria]|eukprot:XP_005706793.1 nucleic acid binding protein [Galdieria sulphuraria]